jgi:Flp pilus assembly protein TadG
MDGMQLLPRIRRCQPWRGWGRLAAFGRARDGGVAVLLAVSLAALLGTVALAIELGRAWNLQSQLLFAADAAALAAATQLDGNTGARQRAIAAAAGALAKNTQAFATDGLGADVLFDTSAAIDPGTGQAINQNIRFFSALPLSGPGNEADSDAEARLAVVTVPARRLDFSFAAVIGATPSVTPQARSAAAWQRLYCDTPSIQVCNPNEDPGGDPATTFDPATSCDGGSCVGRGITLRQYAGPGSLAPGDWGLLTLDVVDPVAGSTATVGDASALGLVLADVVTPQTCAADGRVTIGPPPPEDIADRINVRLDIYAAGIDRGDADLQPAANVIKGLVLPPGWTSSADQCRYTTVGGIPDPGASDWLPPANPYDGPGLHANLSDPGGAGYNPIDAMGYPRDACAYPPSQVDESIFGPVQGGLAGCLYLPPPGDPTPPGIQVGSGQYDLDTYLAVHHPGQSEAGLIADGADLPNALEPPISPDGRISRWELYAWETRNIGGTFPNLPVDGAPRCYRPGETFAADYALPEPPAVDQPDRRLLLAAVVNCASAGGAQSIALRAGPVGSVAIFLIEPVGSLVPDGLYGEIVDPRSLGDGTGTGFALYRDRVVLVE